MMSKKMKETDKEEELREGEYAVEDSDFEN